MGIIATIIVGAIAGWLASWIMKTGTGLVVDTILGIIGGFVAGFLTSLILGENLMTGINLWSIIVAALGAILVVVLYRAIRGRGRV